jgi:hypothetical protein
MLADTMLTQVMDTDSDGSFFTGTAHDAGAHGHSDEFGEKRNDIQTHAAAMPGRSRESKPGRQRSAFLYPNARFLYGDDAEPVKPLEMILAR